MKLESNHTNNVNLGTSILPFNGAVLGSDFVPVRPDDQNIDSQGYWLIIQGKLLVVLEIDGQFQLPQGESPIEPADGQEPLFIGHWRGRPLHVQTVSADIKLPASYTSVAFHGVEAGLDCCYSSLAGLGSQIMHWEKRSRFCSSCGSKLERIPGTWGKQCPSCRAQHYPHIHPCIIVLVRKGNEFLLIRKVGDPEGYNRLIAGFVEFGESLEECVQREVREEAGIEVTNIQYAGSQNWPFPSQHMIGFLAEYAGGELKPDGVEVEDVRWFTPATLPRDPADIRSIARWMMHVFGRTERLEVS